MSANPAASNFDPASLLDGTIDELEDLPGFSRWPAGAYAVTLPAGFTPKEVNKKPCFELKCKLIEVVELSDPTTADADMPKAGDETSLLFMMDNETGRGFFKQAITPFAAMAGSNDRRACVEASKGASVMIVLAKTVKGDRDYNNLKQLQLL